MITPALVTTLFLGLGGAFAPFYEEDCHQREIFLMPTSTHTENQRETSYLVRVFETPDKRERIMAGNRPSGATFAGLYAFPEDGHYEFHTRSLQRAHDFLFLNARGEVVEVHHSVDAGENIVVKNETPARHILTILPGNSARDGFFEGARVRHPFIQHADVCQAS